MMRAKSQDKLEPKAAKPPITGVLSLGQLLEHRPTPAPALIEPGLLPPSGILFLGGEPKSGKSILVANLALALAAGGDHCRLYSPITQTGLDLPV
jgi:KaiC/GvpD/RAD55 family RecA-like ATPase